MVYVDYYWKDTSMCVEGNGFFIVKCCYESNLRSGVLLSTTGKLVGAKSARSTYLAVVYFHKQNRDLITNVDFLRNLTCVSGCFVKHFSLQWGRNHHLCVRQAEAHRAAGCSQDTPADTQLSSSDGKLDCGKRMSAGTEAVLALQAG